MIRAKGATRVAFTTDQNLVAGMPAGRYRFGPTEVQSDGSRVYLRDGTLAGSASTMDDIVGAVVARPVCSRREAIAMASLVPARALGLERHVGRIGARAAADLVVLDETWQVRWTVVAGRIVYEREDN